MTKKRSEEFGLGAYSISEIPGTPKISQEEKLLKKIGERERYDRWIKDRHISSRIMEQQNLLELYPKRIYCISDADSNITRVLTRIGNQTYVLQSLESFIVDSLEREMVLLSFSNRTDAEEFLEQNTVNYNPVKKPLQVVLVETRELPLEAVKSIKFEKEKVAQCKAIVYVNSLVSPLRPLCIEVVKKKKKSSVLKHSIFSILAVVLTLTICEIVMKGLKEDSGAGILIVILWGLCCFWIYHTFDKLLADLFLSKKENKGNLEEEPPIHLRQDYALFCHLLWKLHTQTQDLNLDYFVPYNNTSKNWDKNITFELYQRVKIFALNSFLEAERQGDESSQLHILHPMIKDIIDEAVVTYKNFKEDEAQAKEKLQKELANQINIDLQAYENRLFKK